jgi:hypothetical protein
MCRLHLAVLWYIAYLSLRALNPQRIVNAVDVQLCFVTCVVYAGEGSGKGQMRTLYSCGLDVTPVQKSHGLRSVFEDLHFNSQATTAQGLLMQQSVKDFKYMSTGCKYAFAMASLSSVDFQTSKLATVYQDEENVQLVNSHVAHIKASRTLLELMSAYKNPFVGAAVPPPTHIGGMPVYFGGGEAQAGHSDAAFDCVGVDHHNVLFSQPVCQRGQNLDSAHPTTGMALAVWKDQNGLFQLRPWSHVIGHGLPWRVPVNGSFWVVHCPTTPTGLFGGDAASTHFGVLESMLGKCEQLHANCACMV